MTSTEITAGAVTALVRDAARAPSLHNSQPWSFRFRAADRVLELRGDPDRALPVADPAGRALHLACGAALGNLRVAAAAAGWEAVVRLLPDPDEPLLLARVELAPGAAPSPLALLYPAIAQRHSSREPFSDRPVPDHVRRALREQALTEGARLVFPDRWHSRLVLDLTDEAADREAGDRLLRAEVRHWTRPGAARDRAVDGIVEDAFGPLRRDGRAPVRAFAGGGPREGRRLADFEQEPQLALLTTAGDRPADWLRAGQAMERVLLEATRRGLATALASAALEQPELRWAVSDPRAAAGHVQMVLRLGYGPAGPATGRRPVAQILRIE